MFTTIYLDSAATTRDRTYPYIDISWDENWIGNSHSIHAMGIRSANSIGKSNCVILDHINGHDGRLLFTGSGSQANSLAIRACSFSDTFVTSAIEHKSVLQYQDEYFTIAPNIHGMVDPIKILDAANESTDLVSLQLVNNETGIYQQVGRLKHALEAFNPLIHTDAVQALGKVVIDVEDLGVDMMTISAHKIGGPKGIGALWVRNSVYDKHDFSYLGTESGELINRFAAAVSRIDIQIDQDKIALLENEFIQTLQETDVKFSQTSNVMRVVGILSLCFPGINNDDLVFALSEKGVYISAGSACDGGKVEPSHVLLAMGISEVQAKETVRISISKDNTIDEMQRAAFIVAETIKELKHD